MCRCFACRRFCVLVGLLDFWLENFWPGHFESSTSSSLVVASGCGSLNRLERLFSFFTGGNAVQFFFGLAPPEFAAAAAVSVSGRLSKKNDFF